MKCLVCRATWEGTSPRCPQCDFEHDPERTPDVSVIRAARAAFLERTTAYAPESRVTTFDRCKPWLGLGLGLLLFVFWLRACATRGFL